MTNNEQAIEKEIQDKGLNAPRLSPELIDAKINSVHYIHPVEATKDAVSTLDPDQRSLYCLTLCVLVLRNGFTVVGKSACASPENFDKELGEKIAFADARQQIWALEGYALKEWLALRAGQVGASVE